MMNIEKHLSEIEEAEDDNSVMTGKSKLTFKSIPEPQSSIVSSSEKQNQVKKKKRVSVPKIFVQDSNRLEESKV